MCRKGYKISGLGGWKVIVTNYVIPESNSKLEKLSKIRNWLIFSIERKFLKKEEMCEF